MKTQIIQFNIHDDLLSLRDKMSWSQAHRILLVPASGETIPIRQLDLVILKRHATQLGAQLAIITHDEEIQQIASQAGMLVFNDLRSAQEVNWQAEKIDVIKTIHEHKLLADLHKPTGASSREWERHPVTRTVALGLSVLAVLVLAFFVLPGATIMITPQVKEQTRKLIFTIDPAMKTISYANESLPIETHELILDGSKTIDATGEMLIPDQFAEGVLSFTNISEHSITIPMGTIVSTIGETPIRFITTSSDVSINPGESVDVNARAELPGSAANLQPDLLTHTSGGLWQDATVTNASPTQGGTDATVPSPTSTDLETLKVSLISELKKSGLTSLQSELSTDETIIAPSLRLVETIEEIATPAIGEPGHRLSLSLRLRFEYLTVNIDDLRRIVNPILNADIPHGYRPIDDSLVFTTQTTVEVDSGTITQWDILAQRKLKSNVAADHAISQVKGLPVSRATDRLNHYLNFPQALKIETSPSWWPLLPFLTIRMQVLQVETQ